MKDASKEIDKEIDELLALCEMIRVSLARLRDAIICESEQTGSAIMDHESEPIEAPGS